MQQCIGKTQKGIRCKIKCSNKLCSYHSKKTHNGGNNKLKKQIDNLYRKWDDLESEYEDTQDDEIADKRDNTYLKMEKLTIKYLKEGGKFKDLELSSNWKKSDFQVAGTKKCKKCKGECSNKLCRYHSKKKQTGGAFGKKKQVSTYKQKIDLDKYPQVIIEQKRQKHLKQLVGENKANLFCAMSDVRPGQAGYAVQDNNNGLVAIIDDEIVGFLLFNPKKRGKLSGGNYMYLELICATSKKRKDKKGKTIPIGTLLLTKFEQISRQLGYYKLKGESVKEAVKFYERNGWKVGNDKQHKMTKKIF